MVRKLTFLSFFMAVIFQAAAQTPVFIKDFSTGPVRYLQIGNTLYFAASDNTNGEELWKSDGTTAGTVLVKDIRPGSGSSLPQNFTNVNGTLFFKATNGTSGFELWKSDGTAAGTVMVKEINPGSAEGVYTNNDTQPFSVINNAVIFSGNDGVNGLEPWVSDGTAAGTFMLKNAQAGATGSFPQNFVELSGIVYFGATDGTVNDRTFWRTNGTAAGTYRVYKHNATSFDQVENITKVGNFIYFTAVSSNPSNSKDLLKSTGTASGTTLVTNLGSYSQAYNFCALNNLLIFSNTDLTNGREPWVSNGTAAGTFLLKDINPGTAWSTIEKLKEVNGVVYFTATSAANGEELWKTNGTIAGTTLVKDINPGTSGSSPSSLVKFNNELFFQANDGTNGNEVWRSNGTAAGTAMLFNLNPGYAYGSSMVYAGTNTLYFSGVTGNIFTTGLYKVGNLTSGVNDILPNEKTITVYPNPTNGNVKLQLDNKNYSISIYNVHGQLIFESTEPVAEVDLAKEPKGIYFAQIQTSSGMFTKKIIKQ